MFSTWSVTKTAEPDDRPGRRAHHLDDDRSRIDSTVAAGDVSGARVDDRPFRTELVSLTTSQGTCSRSERAAISGACSPVRSVTVTAVTRATHVGDVVNCVRVGSEEIESDYLNNTACAAAQVIGDPPPILDRCRSLVVSPRLLRAARESIVLVTARNLLGRPLAGVGVRARGAGVAALAGRTHGESPASSSRRRGSASSASEASGRGRGPSRPTGARRASACCHLGNRPR